MNRTKYRLWCCLFIVILAPVHHWLCEQHELHQNNLLRKPLFQLGELVYSLHTLFAQRWRNCELLLIKGNNSDMVHCKSTVKRLLRSNVYHEYDEYDAA